MIDTTTLPIAKKQSSVSPTTILYSNKFKQLCFTTDIIGNKHTHKEGTFKLSNSVDRQTKSYISSNMGIRQCATANEQGLICLLEEDSANFYASNSLLDASILQGYPDAKQTFRVQPKKQG